MTAVDDLVIEHGSALTISTLLGMCTKLVFNIINSNSSLDQRYHDFSFSKGIICKI